jgi:hypothetical protein
MSRGKAKGAPPPVVLPVPRVRVVRDEEDSAPSLEQVQERRAPSPVPCTLLARKRRIRFVF